MRKVDPAKHEQKRRDILQAAADCFDKKGFNASSVAEICAAASISPGHLYHYFTSKEDIIEALTEVRLAAATAALTRILDRPDPFGTFIEMVVRAKPASRTASVEVGRPALLLEILAEASRNPAIAKMVQKQSRTIRNLLGDVLKKGQEAGKVDTDLDPHLAAAVLGGVLIDATKTIAIRAPDLSQKKISDMVALLVTRLLAPR